MQSEESVQVENVFTRNVDRRTHRIVSALTMRHHNVQAIRRPALEDNDQPPGARAGLDGTVRSSRQKAWHRGRPHDRQSAIAKKYATSDAHVALQIVNCLSPVPNGLSATSDQLPAITRLPHLL